MRLPLADRKVLDVLSIEDSGLGYLHITVDGELQPSDYADFVPAFEQLVRSMSPPVAMLLELGSQFSGWSLAGLWEELKFDVEHAEVFGPMAIVGDKRWEQWGTELSNPFFSAEMRFFQLNQRQQAEQWLKDFGSSRKRGSEL